MKKILLIGTGGTIMAKIVNGLWRSGEFNEQELLKFIPEINNIVKIETINLFNIDSSNMQPKYWLKIAETIENNYQKFDGFVITHGTDTMHYTASVLSFLIQNLSKPIVLTGSQIPPQYISSDARRNVLDSIRVVNESKIHEVVIVFNGKIIRGNRAKKFREIELEAFESIGMLLIKIGYKGIVIEGFGAGNVPIDENSLIPEIESATKKRIPIIISTQCAIGCSWVYLYECGKKALDAGAIPGYDIVSETALTKLMWILGNFPHDMGKIKTLMLSNVAGEISDAKTPKEKRIWEYAL